jgi:hypothetical protein
LGLKLQEREKRSTDRRRRRVPVRYGLEKAQFLGYTSDLGEKGLFLQANHLFYPGTVLRLEIVQEDGERTLRGIVRWVKEVPPAFRRSLRGGMGIELI